MAVLHSGYEVDLLRTDTERTVAARSRTRYPTLSATVCADSFVRVWVRLSSASGNTTAFESDTHKHFPHKRHYWKLKMPLLTIIIGLKPLFMRSECQCLQWFRG